MPEPSNGGRDLRDAIGAAHAEKHDLEAAQLTDLRKAHEEKHADLERAVDTAISAERQRLMDHRIAHEAAHAAHEALHLAFGDAHKQQHANEHNAVAAATAAMDKRLDGMNEFRDQLRDQAASFVRSDSFEVFKEERRHALTALDATIDNRIEALVTLIRTERDERVRMDSAHALIHRGEEGIKKGLSTSVAIIVGAITLAVTILGAIILVANFATGTP